MRRIKVLIIDDSETICNLLSKILNSDDEINVVATAKDPYEARQKIKELNPDVLTLDVEMPLMDGVTFLRNLMRLRPMPVVMISSLTQPGVDVTFKALQIGAIDFVPKPVFNKNLSISDYSDEIISKVKAASLIPVNLLEKHFGSLGKSVISNDTKKTRTTTFCVSETVTKIIAIGASTGGTEAIRQIIENLPVSTPPVVIAQHIPAVFSFSFASRLNNFTQLMVTEAKHGARLLPGCAYIAPGGMHLTINKYDSNYYCHLDDGEKVNRHKPSVDILFNSIAKISSLNAMGVLLTGMGNDGASGLIDMKKKGASVLVQNEASSVVWGMPASALKLDSEINQLDLEGIYREIIRYSQKN